MIFNQWYAILPSSSVRPLHVLAVRRLNMDLVLFRNANGELGCVVDQCTHRGAALSGGKIRGSCLQCPFHGLEFDVSGRCTFVPAYGRASTEDLTRFNVRRYLVREEHGIVYLWYGDEDKVEANVPFFAVDIDSSYSYSEMCDLWNAHYSRCIENQLDVVHVPIVHYNTIGRGHKTLVNGPKVVLEDNTIVTSANNDVDRGQLPKAPSECVIKQTNLQFKFPNIWMNHISSRIKVIIYFAPVDDVRTVLYIRFYCKVTSIAPINALIAFFGKFANRVIERQDKRVVVTQRPKASSYVSHENLLTGDGPVVLYRKMRESLKQSQGSAKA
ncbi:MAG TPA: aromatic ring-hydroxylating dioxygenase subunit alpha [Candidatus Cryosericum sp.]|nr:aromatic ring-hydroxylating dioxygenase subunit alpha [Candidatus Cryosericum sp.]